MERGCRLYFRSSIVRNGFSERNYRLFMDGDCFPDTDDFLGKYAVLLQKHDLVFGTRRHTDVDGLDMPPSDLLTANMDNMWKGNPIDYTDLRVVAGAVTAWQEAKTFSERLDLMLTGMIGWSCNFGFSKEGLIKLRKLYLGISRMSLKML